MADENRAATMVDTEPRIAAAPRVTALFRREVVDARREKALGDVLLVQPPSTAALTVVAVATASALVAFAFWGEYTRKAHVTGYLVPTQGLIKIYSRETGTVVEKHVVEGQQVSAGDVLFVLSMERGSSETGAAQAAAMAQMRERQTSLNADLVQQEHLGQIENDGLLRQIDATEKEIAKLSDERATQERRVESAQKTLLMYQELVVRLLGSTEMVEEKRKELLDQQSKLESLERDRITVSRQLDVLRAQVPASEIEQKTKRAAIERDISTLAQQLTEYESRRSFVITAPADGTATAVLADPGQTATPAQPLVSILPRGTVLEAHLFVPSASIGFAAVGQKVALRYQAYPYQRFGSYMGQVSAIARTLILPNETVLPSPLSEPAYRVTVTLDQQAILAYGQQFPLQSGMLLDASIWLDRRKLYQWLLDPLYSVLGRV